MSVIVGKLVPRRSEVVVASLVDELSVSNMLVVCSVLVLSVVVVGYMVLYFQVVSSLVVGLFEV